MKLVSYAPAIGSLMYAMVATLPDIARAVVVISRFMHNPGRSHWNAVKHVLTYLTGTKDHGSKPNLKRIRLHRLGFCQLCGQSKINNQILF